MSENTTLSIELIKLSQFSGLKKLTKSPATSRKTGISEQITGHLFLIDSKIDSCFALDDGSALHYKNGKIHTLKEGDLFYVPPEPHDSWVVGDEQYVSLHFLDAEKYAD